MFPANQAGGVMAPLAHIADGRDAHREEQQVFDTVGIFHNAGFVKNTPGGRLGAVKTPKHHKEVIGKRNVYLPAGLPADAEPGAIQN